MVYSSGQNRTRWFSPGPVVGLEDKILIFNFSHTNAGTYGDVGAGEGGLSVYKLIKEEGAELVLHQGDFDYESNPEFFDENINIVFGPSFPYLASVGNHELDQWTTIPGYQDYLSSRLKKDRQYHVFGENWCKLPLFVPRTFYCLFGYWNYVFR